VKTWIYAVLVTASVSLWAGEIKKNAPKMEDTNQSSQTMKSMKSSLETPIAVGQPKKKKVVYPRGTIATH